ncbi:helix-turn-helix domain-containing protein [Lacticaseibacillus paracasei]|uniref:helix-turn-helix domain-containing protein n=1 Tax=Lacticaseibacillus paracasei TaxID=1597 RepID=UPI003CFE137C
MFNHAKSGLLASSICFKEHMIPFNAANTLKEARKDAGISQQKLADQAGVTQASIANIEKGRNTTLDTYCKALAIVGLELKVVPIK